MSSQSTRKGTETSGSKSTSEHFERNAYFHGKLMTAHDMETEQEYHRDRLHVLARHGLGSGLVCGLQTTVEAVRADDGSGHLQAKVEPGLAIDRQGRPIKVSSSRWVDVKHAESDELKLPGEQTDVIALYLSYSECFVDSVPVPDVLNACEERCCYNRVVEQFEVTFTEGDPGVSKMKTIPPITFPDRSDFPVDDEGNQEARPSDRWLFEMARDYYETEPIRDCEPYNDFSIFLGVFKRSREGEYKGGWEMVTNDELDRRSLVYTNDMLYAILARHVTDYANPHEVEFDGLQSINEAEANSTDGRLKLTSNEEQWLKIEKQSDSEVRFSIDVGLTSISDSDGDDATGDDGDVELRSLSERLTIEREEAGVVTFKLDPDPRIERLEKCIREIVAQDHLKLPKDICTPYRPVDDDDDDDGPVIG